MRILAACAVLALWQFPVQAQEPRFFQIGTGPTGETRFPLGGLLANALSNPPGSRDCEKGGSCGVPGLVAVARSTDGSLANIDAVAKGRLDAALVQADIAYWAYHGTGIYRKKGAVSNLRAISMLYSESLHLVARKTAAIRSVRDLRGKKVSLGEEGSGSLVHGRMLLKAYGLSEKSVRLRKLAPGPAADALARGELDAVLMTDGFPVPAIVELARTTPITLVPIDGAQAEAVSKAHPFLRPSAIPAGTYDGIDQPVPTLDVGVALVTSAAQPDDLIYGITRALWHPSTYRLLSKGFPRGKLVHMDARSIRALGIQLHGGAAAYYFDAGVLD